MYAICYRAWYGEEPQQIGRGILSATKGGISQTKAFKSPLRLLFSISVWEALLRAGGI